MAECRFASLVLAKKLHLEDALSLTTLRAVQEKAGRTLEEMYDAVQQLLHREPYTVADVAEILGLTVRSSIIANVERVGVCWRLVCVGDAHGVLTSIACVARVSFGQ